MFGVLSTLVFTRLDEASTSTDTSGLSGPTEPPAGYIPPLGASRATWPNIMKNKSSMDYCAEEFHHLMNR